MANGLKYDADEEAEIGRREVLKSTTGVLATGAFASVSSAANGIGRKTRQFVGVTYDPITHQVQQEAKAKLTFSALLKPFLTNTTTE